MGAASELPRQPRQDTRTRNYCRYRHRRRDYRQSNTDILTSNDTTLGDGPSVASSAPSVNTTLGDNVNTPAPAAPKKAVKFALDGNINPRVPGAPRVKIPLGGEVNLPVPCDPGRETTAVTPPTAATTGLSPSAPCFSSRAVSGVTTPAPRVRIPLGGNVNLPVPGVPRVKIPLGDDVLVSALGNPDPVEEEVLDSGDHMALVDDGFAFPMLVLQAAPGLLQELHRHPAGPHHAGVENWVPKPRLCQTGPASEPLGVVCLGPDAGGLL